MGVGDGFFLSLLPHLMVYPRLWVNDGDRTSDRQPRPDWERNDKKAMGQKARLGLVRHATEHAGCRACDTTSGTAPGSGSGTAGSTKRNQVSRPTLDGLPIDGKEKEQ